MLWQLFWTFLEIGAVSFGGGYGMISLIREKVLLHGWLEETQFLSFIAVSESTPGPLAINMATFIGASQAGAAGAICATLGVVLPSFFIILLIAALIHNLLQYAGVNAFLSGIRPCVVALILACWASPRWRIPPPLPGGASAFWRPCCCSILAGRSGKAKPPPPLR